MNATEAMERTKEGVILKNLNNSEYEDIIKRISSASDNGYTAIYLYKLPKKATIEKLEAEGYYVGALRTSLLFKRRYVSWNGRLKNVPIYVLLAQCFPFIFIIYVLYLAVVSINQ